MIEGVAKLKEMESQQQEADSQPQEADSQPREADSDSQPQEVDSDSPPKGVVQWQKLVQFEEVQPPPFHNLSQGERKRKLATGLGGGFEPNPRDRTFLQSLAE